MTSERFRALALPLLSAVLVLSLCACGAGMFMKKPEQGISGVFSTYGPPATLANCEPMVTQAQKDSCKRENQRVIEEPLQGEVEVRNLGTGATAKATLDGVGSFKVLLSPGSYEVCVEGECSDPLEVRMGAFTTYGQRLPRPEKAPSDSARPGR